MKNEYQIKGPITEIYIHSGKYGTKTLLIDTADLPKVQEKVKNSITIKKGSGKEKWYAVYQDNKKHYFMHRMILDYDGDLLVDHKDGNGLNDTRDNLRIVTVSQNAMNIESYAHSQSGIKGLVYDDLRREWRVRIKIEGKVKFEKFYKSKEKALEVLDRKLEKYHGEFRRQ